MLIPISEVDSIANDITDVNLDDVARDRAIADLLRNANDSCYCNERGFRQKLIDNLYNLGYYRTNESVYASVKEQE